MLAVSLSTQLGKGVLMDDKPSLIVYELAHRVREALSDVAARERVRDSVRETLGKQWSEYKEKTLAHDALSRVRVEATKAYYRDETVKIPEVPVGSRPPAMNRLAEWPFPIEHGIEESPGCVLHLAALNDFAFEHSTEFYKHGVEFEPLLPFGLGSEQMTGPWFWYGTIWVDAISKLEPGHFERFNSAIDAALRSLIPPPKRSMVTPTDSTQVALDLLRRISRQLEDFPELPLSSVGLCVWKNPDGLSTEDAAGFLARPVTKVDYVCGTAWLSPSLPQSVAGNAIEYRGCIAAGICPQMPRPWLPDNLTVSAGFQIESLQLLASAGCALMRVSGIAKELWGEKAPDESVLRGNCGLVVWLSALVELANRNTFVGNINNELVSKLWHWRQDYERKRLHTCWPGSPDELLEGFDRTRTAALINRPIAASRQALVWALDWAASSGVTTAFNDTDQTEDHKAVFTKIVEHAANDPPPPQKPIHEIVAEAKQEIFTFFMKKDAEQTKRLNMRADKQERQNKVKLTPKQREQNTKLTFIRKRRNQGKNWRIIAAEWNAKPPFEWGRARNLADAMERFWRRYGDK
jgi:hypothetical protein